MLFKLPLSAPAQRRQFITNQSRRKTKHTKMASLLSLLCTYCILLLFPLFGVEAVKDFKVGDEFGWQEPGHNNTAVYTQWATRNRFHVGDSLSFEYKNDSVLEVDKWGYYHCNAIKATIGFNNGKSLFQLDSSGPFYFISGNASHCRNGQRLLVEVMGTHDHHHPVSPSPPPANADPPESFLSPGPLPASTSGSGSSALVLSLNLLYSLLMTLMSYHNLAN